MKDQSKDFSYFLFFLCGRLRSGIDEGKKGKGKVKGSEWVVVILLVGTS